MLYQLILINVIASIFLLFFNFFACSLFVEEHRCLVEFLTVKVLRVAFPLYSLTCSPILWVSCELLGESRGWVWFGNNGFPGLARCCYFP